MAKLDQAPKPGNLTKLTSNSHVPEAHRLRGKSPTPPRAAVPTPVTRGSLSKRGGTLAQFKSPDLIIYANARIPFVKESSG